MKTHKIIPFTAALLTGCATGSTADTGFTPTQDEDPTLQVTANGQYQVPTDAPEGGTGGSGGGSTVSSSSSSVVSSSASGGDQQPPPPPPPAKMCGPGLTLCADMCASTATDPFNCGGCGNVCKTGQTCSSGKCTVTGTLYVAGDDAAEAYIDGKLVATNPNWFVATKVTVTLPVGDHVVAILGKNAANGTHPGAVILDLGFGSTRIATGPDWDSSVEFQAGWADVKGSLLNPVVPATHGDIFNTMWWNRDPVTFAAKNFPDDSKAMWLWSEGFLTDSVVYFRKGFTVE